MPEAFKNPDLENALKKEGLTEEAPTSVEPSYRMIGSEKIPVSKKLGSLWQGRLDQARGKRTDCEANWSEAIRYYENDQSSTRTSVSDQSGTRSSRRIGRQWTQTENVVFANCCTMLPMLYAKNPVIECTAINPDVNEPWAKAGEALVNALFSMQTSPGVAIKSTARRGILWTLLTNNGYVKLKWTNKADSSEQAIEDVRKLSLEYQHAKTPKDLKVVEGKLMALDEKISMLSPAGPSIELISPFRLYVDPTSNKADHSDANWIMEEDYMQTEFINAMYGKESDGKIVSVYEPTHVLNASDDTNEIQDEVNNFSLFKSDADEQASKSYGYNSVAAYKKAQYTKVFWVWDKTTRRVYLYADNKWTWPMWVWDDPLKLLEFFPYYHLHFHEQVEGSQPKGEVTYYLDQQDAINDNNAAIAQARDWAKNNVVFDKKIASQKDVEQLLRGPNGTATGIDLPEGMKIEDVIKSVVPPSMQHPELMNNDQLFAAIDRITGIIAAQRGAQFKTNTTNDAIDFYQKNVDIRVDEKIDAIEDWLGAIGWGLLQLLASKWNAQQVSDIIGPTLGNTWKQVGEPSELRGKMSLRTVGGSTDKPTSKNKKQQALQMGQILGQFSGGSPAAIIVALKVLERAFGDEITITQGDWDMIMKSIEDQANAAGAGPGGTPGGGGGEQDPQQMALRQQMAETIAKLPAAAKAQLEGLVNHGVPPSEALKQVMAQAAQSQQPN